MRNRFTFATLVRNCGDGSVSVLLFQNLAQAELVADHYREKHGESFDEDAQEHEVTFNEHGELVMGAAELRVLREAELGSETEEEDEESEDDDELDET